jgi:Domain of unknown function (DUF4124)
MLKRLFIGITTLVVAGAVFGQAYTWVDKEGIVHYSDRPVPGAERIQLPTSKPSSRPYSRPMASTNNAAEQAKPAKKEQPFSYKSLTFTAPVAEETLWNIEGVLNVSLDLRPGLQPGHRVRVFVDGTPRMVSGTSFELDEVYRGVHNLQAEVLDETGKMMIRSRPNRFYVQKNTIIHH